MTGTKFCDEDGTKLVSPEKLIPKCVKCGKIYIDGTKFCPEDGGKISVGVNVYSNSSTSDFIGNICDTVENSLNSQNWQKSELNKNSGKIVLGLSIAVAIIDAYIILRFFALPKWQVKIVGGIGNAFPLYLKHDVLGWVIFACVLAVITYFINGLLLEAMDRENQYSKAGNIINYYAGGLAAIFLVVGLLAKVIVGY